MTMFERDFIERVESVIGSKPFSTAHTIADAIINEFIRLNKRVQELEQERRWIPVRDYPSQVGWYRVITNNGTEQIREYVREPDRDIHYWDVKDGEWIMMYTNPPLPQPPQEGE